MVHTSFVQGESEYSAFKFTIPPNTVIHRDIERMNQKEERPLIIEVQQIKGDQIEGIFTIGPGDAGLILQQEAYNIQVPWLTQLLVGRLRTHTTKVKV